MVGACMKRTGHVRPDRYLSSSGDLIVDTVSVTS